MSAPSALGTLGRLFAELYPSVESSRRVVDEAGLASDRIAFQGAAAENWHGILAEADRGRAVAALVEVARGEYSERAAELSAALDDYRALPAPDRSGTLIGSKGEGAKTPRDPAPPAWAWWMVGIAVPLGVALIAFLPGLLRDPEPAKDSIYHVRVTVLDPQGSPVEDAKVWSSFGGEPKKVAGGWQFDIPAASKPQDGALTVFAKREAAFERGETSVVLGEDPNVPILVGLSKELGSVRGEVRHGGVAVAGASVRVMGYPEEAVETGPDGGFVLPAHAAAGEEVRLEVEHPDFRPTALYHPAGETAAIIVLRKP